MGGYSAQPVFGGPVYFIRNTLYHSPNGVAFKFSAKPAGLFVYFQLKPGGKAVDAGVVIPTVNDDFTGKGPDLGAHEVGAPSLRYGPRWLTWQPFYR